jgi:hypothetical protein
VVYAARDDIGKVQGQATSVQMGCEGADIDSTLPKLDLTQKHSQVCVCYMYVYNSKFCARLCGRGAVALHVLAQSRGIFVHPLLLVWVWLVCVMYVAACSSCVVCAHVCVSSSAEDMPQYVSTTSC